jgi:hypothetical protein
VDQLSAGGVRQCTMNASKATDDLPSSESPSSESASSRNKNCQTDPEYLQKIESPHGKRPPQETLSSRKPLKSLKTAPIDSRPSLPEEKSESSVVNQATQAPVISDPQQSLVSDPSPYDVLLGKRRPYISIPCCFECGTVQF